MNQELTSSVRQFPLWIGRLPGNSVRVLAIVLFCAVVSDLRAEPWAEPGDARLRQDIELLADAGLIRGPVTSWPLSWGALSGELVSIELPADADLSLLFALERLKSKMAAETNWGQANLEYGAEVAKTPQRVRSFADTPRQNGSLAASADFTGERFSAKLDLTIAISPNDDKTVQLDGSYVAVAVGNSMISVGMQERWWGPGLDGSMIMSNNARPMPTLSIQRNYTDAFSSRWLSWIGPWTATAFLGEMESSRGVSGALTFGARVAFRPLEGLEIGVSRTAQWGGRGRDESFGTLVDLLLGRDNFGDDGITDVSDEPGNQLAGYDWRWRVWRGSRPVVFYGQLIGEDEAGGFPSRFMGQFGVSSSSAVGSSGSRVQVYGEFSDTTCQFYEESKIFNCAYNHPIYTTGYRYRGRPIGHSSDNDARQFSVGAGYVNSSGDRIAANIKVGELNRGGSADARNTLTPEVADLLNIEVSYERDFFDGRATFGIGYDDIDSADDSFDTSDLRGYAQWRSQF